MLALAHLLRDQPVDPFARNEGASPGVTLLRGYFDRSLDFGTNWRNTVYALYSLRKLGVVASLFPPQLGQVVRF